MPRSSTGLIKRLEAKLRGAARVVILGVGSDLRGDDIAGLLVARELEKRFKGRNKMGDAGANSVHAAEVLILHGGTAPENLTGEIRRFQPSHLVIVDAADMGRPPGTVALFAPDEIEGISFSTHQLPFNLMIKFLAESLKFETLIIGIQPRNLSFGPAVSREVRSSIQDVVVDLANALYQAIC